MRQAKDYDKEPTSGFVRPDDILKTDRFTDLSTVPSRGYSLLTRAKRHGRWWMLKGLKEPYRQDAVYQALLQKEYEITSQLQHPMVHPTGGHLPIVRNTPQQLHGTIVAGKFQHCLFFLVCHCLLILVRCKDTLFYPNRQAFIRRIGYGHSCDHVTFILFAVLKLVYIMKVCLYKSRFLVM